MYMYMYNIYIYYYDDVWCSSNALEIDFGDRLEFPDVFSVLSKGLKGGLMVIVRRNPNKVYDMCLWFHCC